MQQHRRRILPELETALIENWIKTLPLPIGVFFSCDHIAQAARFTNRNAPELKLLCRKGVYHLVMIGLARAENG